VALVLWVLFSRADWLGCRDGAIAHDYVPRHDKLVVC
jgi:hypothetical protein